MHWGSSLSLSLSLCHSLCHTHYFSHKPTHTLSLWHTHALTHSLSVAPFVTERRLWINYGNKTKSKRNRFFPLFVDFLRHSDSGKKEVDLTDCFGLCNYCFKRSFSAHLRPLPPSALFQTPVQRHSNAWQGLSIANRSDRPVVQMVA